jgi:hypothetical protein
MATELLRPGVSVIQEFRTVSPTIVTPTLVPCAIAPCFQVLEAYETDATGNRVVNSDAAASLPAIITSLNAGPYSALSGTVLKVRVNNGPTQEVTFAATGSLSASQVKDQINAATRDGWAAYVLTKNSSTYVQLRTNSAGDSQSLQILNGDANSILGFNNFWTEYGVTTYKQDKVYVSQANFPDPRGIIDELDIDESSIRVFVDNGTSSMTELKRDESFLRRGKTAVELSSSAITFPTTTLTSKTLILTFQEGGSEQTVTFLGEASNMAALVVAINALFGSTVAVDGGSGKVKLLSSTYGYIKVGAGTCNTILHIAENDEHWAVEPLDDGDGDSKTPLLSFSYENFLAPGAAATLLGTATLTGEIAVHNKTFILQLDGSSPQEITFDGGAIPGGTLGAFPGAWNGEIINFQVNGVDKTVTFVSPANITAAINQINAVCDGIIVAYANAGKIDWRVGGATPIEGGEVALIYSGSTAWADLGLAGTADIHQTLTLAEIVTLINGTMGTVASNSSNKLLLSSSEAGEESKIEIGQGTANTTLGFTSGAAVYGSPFPVAVGDAVYVDGEFTGYVTQVCPGGVATRIKLDREILKTTADWSGTFFYFIAKKIPSTLPATRPTPDLVVDSAGAVNIKHDIFRDTKGAPINAQGRLIVSYKALRLDVTAEGTDPSLLTITSTDDLDAALLPINTDNPLALMLYFMNINAPGVECTGIGVDAVNSSFPDGTPEAYSRAMTFLEGQEVYALAPATQEAIIHQMWKVHVDMMSEPDNKGERIVFINPKMPTESVPTLVTSGTDGDSTGVTNELDTKLATLPADLLAAGIDPSGAIDVSDGLYIDIAYDSKRYNISAVSGSVITVRVAFAPGENDDAFYSSTNLPSGLVSEAFSIYIRGTALVTSTGKPDYSRIAQAYQDTGILYGDRRVIMVAPDYCGASLEATEQKIKGYYMCAAIAGMVGQLAPQQGFTNYPITGFTRVIGSNGVFSEKQMSVAAAGGTYWILQEVSGGPLTCRHQLTTDLTSVETRELSITKGVDFVAKFMRGGLKNFIGKFNITQPFLDTLSTVVQGQLSFLTESGVLVGGDLNNIVQDKDNPDTVLIDVTLDMPYPCNYLRLTLVI